MKNTISISERIELAFLYVVAKIVYLASQGLLIVAGLIVWYLVARLLFFLFHFLV